MPPSKFLHTPEWGPAEVFQIGPALAKIGPGASHNKISKLIEKWKNYKYASWFVESCGIVSFFLLLSG